MSEQKTKPQDSQPTEVTPRSPEPAERRELLPEERRELNVTQTLPDLSPPTPKPKEQASSE